MPKITWKPGTMLSPLPPALVSCGTVENPNVLTVSWTGIIASEPPLTYVSIRPSRHSHAIIKESGEFVINLPNLDLLIATDYCGVKSGETVNKFKEMNLTALPCSQISAPQIEQAPVSLECKVLRVETFGTHDMFLAEIVAVNIDDKYLDKEGKLCLEKAGLLAFSHGKYFTLGRLVGTFGFSVNKARLKDMQKMQEVKVEVKESKLPRKTEDEKKKSEGRRPRAEGGKRKPFGDKPERKPYGDRPERKPYGERSERKPYGERSERKPYGERSERKPYGERSERKPYGERSERKPYGDRPERKPYGERSERKPFDDRPRGRPTGDRPDRKPFKRDGFKGKRS